MLVKNPPKARKLYTAVLTCSCPFFAAVALHAWELVDAEHLHDPMRPAHYQQEGLTSSAPAPALPLAQAVQSSPPSGTLPVVPQGATVRSETTPTALVVHSILYGEARKFAVVNDQLLKEGSQIAEYTVRGIYPNRVVFSGPEGQREEQLVFSLKQQSSQHVPEEVTP